MEINKMVVKLGKEYYTGYYWIEATKNGKRDIYISYEGIRKKQSVKLEQWSGQKKIAEEMFYKLLNEL